MSHHLATANPTLSSQSSVKNKPSFDTFNYNEPVPQRNGYHTLWPHILTWLHPIPNTIYILKPHQIHHFWYIQPCWNTTEQPYMYSNHQCSHHYIAHTVTMHFVLIPNHFHYISSTSSHINIPSAPDSKSTTYMTGPLKSAPSNVFYPWTPPPLHDEPLTSYNLKVLYIFLTPILQPYFVKFIVSTFQQLIYVDIPNYSSITL